MYIGHVGSSYDEFLILKMCSQQELRGNQKKIVNWAAPGRILVPRTKGKVERFFLDLSFLQKYGYLRA